MVSSLTSCGLRRRPAWWESEPTASTVSLVGICLSVTAGSEKTVDSVQRRGNHYNGSSRDMCLTYRILWHQRGSQLWRPLGGRWCFTGCRKFQSSLWMPPVWAGRQSSYRCLIKVGHAGFKDILLKYFIHTNSTWVKVSKYLVLNVRKCQK